MFALGQPEVEITQLDDGKELTFTAEVDVRPKFELPDLDGAGGHGRQRRGHAGRRGGVPHGAARAVRHRSRPPQRPAEDGDYVTIDLSASVDGKPVEDAQASGLSYQIGSGTMLEGLDEALTGMSAGESATFTERAGGRRGRGRAGRGHGDRAGRQGEGTARARRRVRPAGQRVRHARRAARRHPQQLERIKRIQQANQARDKAIEALVDSVDIPLPEKFVEHEVEHRREGIDSSSPRSGMSLADYLKTLRRQRRSSTPSSSSSRSARSRSASSSTSWPAPKSSRQPGRAVVLRRRPGAAEGIGPEYFARQLTESGQIGTAFTRCCAARPPGSSPSGSR